MGVNDEVLDLVLMGECNIQLAVACSSPAIRLYIRGTWNCVLVTGHTATVLYLATCPGDTSTMARGGKEREGRPWKVEKDRLEYLVVGSGHNEALVGILWSAGPNQLVTVSNDKPGHFCQEPGQHQGRDCP